MAPERTSNRTRRLHRNKKHTSFDTIIGVSAIQARLINARNEVKIITETDEWESCKERVRLEKCKLNILLERYEKYNKDVAIVKPIQSTFRLSESTPRTNQAQAVARNGAEEAQSLPALIKVFVNQHALEVAMITKDVENMHIIDQVPEVELNPLSRIRSMRNEEQWKKCKERVRLEREKLRKMYTK